LCMSVRENQAEKAGKVKCEGGWIIVLGIVIPFCYILSPEP